MLAIHSVLHHSDNTLGNHQQQGSQTYSDLFPEIDNAPSNSEYDFDLYNIIVNAVDYLKNQPEVSKDSSKTKSGHNIKHPCGIYHKNVNKNQQATFCTFCPKWVHRKCNGTSFKEYDILTEEDDNLPWQCTLCVIDEMASNFLWLSP